MSTWIYLTLYEILSLGFIDFHYFLFLIYWPGIILNLKLLLLAWNFDDALIPVSERIFVHVYYDNIFSRDAFMM